MLRLKEPTLSNLSDNNFGKPPDANNEILQDLGKPHVSSFNYAVDAGLEQAIRDLRPVSFELPSGERVVVTVDEATVSMPLVPTGTVGVKNPRIYPKECRERKATYRGKLNVKVSWTVDGKKQSLERELGKIPIMLKSKRCHLSKLSPAQLIECNEHPDEWGGYFIIKGHERLIRMLLTTRRNYPVAVKRSGWKSRGALFSDVGISIRCLKEDQTCTTNVVHFLTDGSAKLMFSHRRMLYYLPVILVMKCLMDCSDKYIYECLSRGFENDLFYMRCLEQMFRSLHQENLHTHQECKEYLGRMFRIKIFECPPWSTDEEVADYLLKNCVLIHVAKYEDKFRTLAFMTQKLYMFAQEKCLVEGADGVMMQELIVGGHLYLQVLKEKIQGWLVGLRSSILKRVRGNSTYSLSQTEMATAIKYSGTLESSMESFLSTGNMNSPSGLGMMQDKGLTIVAENINRLRYISHFKSVHRGAFFIEMRTTEARQLLPDAWGFICPVHTPDGSPCGLLNHLTTDCTVTDVPDAKKVANMSTILVNLGMIPVDTALKIDFSCFYTTILDGRVIGHVDKKIVFRLVSKLRMLKIVGVEIPNTTEIVLVTKRDLVGQFPGLFLFTGPARMMRPVMNLVVNKIELIGTFEQVYLDISITAEDAYKGITTHMELSKMSFLSNLAQLIPMPDCNQSPRNMYQCQMGKQTMGTPLHTWGTQADTKLYRLQTPATPLFRPVHHDNIQLDNYAMGTNAIVAVISYTGYDMEDAMIINKSSYERGLAHGSIYKSDFVELKDSSSYFCRNPNDQNLFDVLDTDGLPHPGTVLHYGDPLYCYYNSDESKYSVEKFVEKEDAIVDNVRLCSTFNVKNPRKAIIVFRIPRNPSVGDKFASRAGQKGICSQMWPAEDLPFTETGLVPDIVFNPHGFPSRMTIAMMIELMAGKSAALHGLVHDATPFKFNENDTAINYFGRLLEAAGYNYYGTETLYSGIDGREMPAQIFFGVCHYQRLRHMVSDKWQVRSTGPIDVLTRQPIKGRKRGGGVRFGEMERDSLISHGAMFLLQDRLFHGSDKTSALICTSCNTLLGPVTVMLNRQDNPQLSEIHDTCRLCGHRDNVTEMQMPYILRFLVMQLASVNINVKIMTAQT